MPVTGDPRLAVVGNPDNRRVRLFTEAAVGAGLPRPAVLSWRELLTGAAPPPAGTLVRVDSPGEDAEVDRLLRGAAEPARHGEIVGTAAAHAGLRRALDRLASGGATLLSQPDDIVTMCDKRRCHAVLDAAGVPVPAAVGEVTGYADLRAAMRRAGWSRVFVKPAHGSSASGVLAFAADGSRVVATTPVERAEGRLFNSLRVRRYTDEAEVAEIVDRLAPDALHVERWLPKAGLDGRVVDLRVVVVAGRPTHAVVRAGRGPITNLHLGNARGDLAALRAAAGPTSWAAAMETCARVAACFPRTLHVAVDLMFLVGWARHAVAEVNAFGDLLPGVLADGRDTYATQLHALRGGWRPAGGAGRETACAT
ncbi:STM4014 family protein [Micromonospora inyonensis]|uniref:ATP-grasp domain-containing protein n=1 Tax=Micromonospora inyonensis TaxID=47866 RepID=A0A1C6S9F1_9ACTN|nr:STM4014 family protein [Micromonospora inyonensis]SCL26083.1 ATP-grasp domain-containing protein [Micromonospora inyonensis]